MTSEGGNKRALAGNYYYAEVTFVDSARSQQIDNFCAQFGNIFPNGEAGVPEVGKVNQHIRAIAIFKVRCGFFGRSALLNVTLMVIALFSYVRICA
jgi:hypothetical protein